MVLIRPTAAVMIFSVTRDDFDHTEEGRFTLLHDGSIYAINPADYAELRALQALTRQWKAENEDATSGSPLIDLSSPCRLGEALADDATVNVAIQMEQGGAFLPLVRNGPLSAVTSEEQLRDMSDCP